MEEIETDGDLCSESSEASAQSMTDSLQLGEFQSLSLADESGGCVISTQEESYMSLTTIQPLRTRRCGQDCQCRCHGNIGEDDNYSWMSTVFGSWRVRNQTVDRTCEMQCGPSMGPEFEYRPPRWLWSGVIPFGSFQHARPVLTCSLRAPRTIGWTEHAWEWVKKPLDFQNHIRDGWTPFPDDTDEFGRDFIEVSRWDRLGIGNTADFEFCRQLSSIKHMRVLRFCLSCGKMCSHSKDCQGCIMQKPDYTLG